MKIIMKAECRHQWERKSHLKPHYLKTFLLLKVMFFKFFSLQFVLKKIFILSSRSQEKDPCCIIPLVTKCCTLLLMTSLPWCPFILFISRDKLSWAKAPFVSSACLLSFHPSSLLHPVELATYWKFTFLSLLLVIKHLLIVHIGYLLCS